MSNTKRLLCIICAFLMLVLCGCQKTEVVETQTEELTAQFEDKGFATAMSNIFGKPASEITEKELASIRYLYISYYDETCNINVGFDDFINEQEFSKKNEYLKTTTASTPLSFKDMKYFTGLKDFGLYNIYTFSDIGVLKNCREIESLDIYTESKNVLLKSLKGVEKLKSLKELSVYGSIITDVSPVGALDKLEVLFIGADYRMYEDGDKCFSDISSFSSLKNLKELTIYYSSVNTLAPIKELGIEHLCLYRCAISDISDIESMTALKSVDLMYNSIQDISPLTKLPNLRAINLDYNYIKDVSPFSAFEVDDIDYITLDMNAIEEWDSVRHLYEANKLNPGYDLYFDDEE